MSSLFCLFLGRGVGVLVGVGGFVLVCGFFCGFYGVESLYNTFVGCFNVVCVHVYVYIYILNIL